MENRAIFEPLDYEVRVRSADRPDVRERTKANAMIGAFGSRKVRKCYDEWVAAIKKVDSELDVLDWNHWNSDGDPSRPIAQSALNRISETLPLEVQARGRLADSIANELGYRR
jgi:hypothetical protein